MDMWEKLVRENYRSTQAQVIDYDDSEDDDDDDDAIAKPPRAVRGPVAPEALARTSTVLRLCSASLHVTTEFILTS